MKCIKFCEENGFGNTQEGVVAIFSDAYPEHQLYTILRDLKNLHIKTDFQIESYNPPDEIPVDPLSLDDIPLFK